MSEGDIQVILHRLDELDRRLDDIYFEVRKTNGRVTELEKDGARSEGVEVMRRRDRNIAMTVIAGGILAAIVWFVETAVR